MPVLLDNPVQTYPWGSTAVLPELLGVPATGEPQAELWVGAHPAAPSRVEVDGRPVSLAEIIDGDPEATLGPRVLRWFGPRLPYLLKVLAVERPLSIQVHPTAEQARTGYDAEESAGVPLDAASRSYRDRSPKPEMVVALTEFEALLGFRDPSRTADMLDGLAVPALADAAALLRGADDGLEALVRRWLLLPRDEAAHLVESVVDAARTVDGPLPRLVTRLAALYPADRGILVALLLRHETLAPGAAVFTAAGVPHAYLRGVAVEVQASSDNTLRAGLTGKHVDTGEVLRILRYDAGGSHRVSPVTEGPGREAFAPPVKEFRLFRVRLDGGPAELPGSGPRVVLVTDGAAGLATGGAQVSLGRGRAAFVPAAERAATLDGRGTAFVAAPGLDAGAETGAETGAEI